MCKAENQKTKPEFTNEDFLSGKRFDYIIYEDRPDFKLYYKSGNLFQGNRLIGEVIHFSEKTYQINVWILGQISVRYLRLENCQHHKPVGHFIKSTINRLKTTGHV